MSIEKGYFTSTSYSFTSGFVCPLELREMYCLINRKLCRTSPARDVINRVSTVRRTCLETNNMRSYKNLTLKRRPFMASPRLAALRLFIWKCEAISS